jgi:hypothetical protein
MSERRASVSGARSYEEIGEYWDTHDAGDIVTGPVDIEVDLKSERFYYPVERSLSDKVIQMAHERGVSAAVLVNLWIQEKVRES